MVVLILWFHILAWGGFSFQPPGEPPCNFLLFHESGIPRSALYRPLQSLPIAPFEWKLAHKRELPIAIFPAGHYKKVVKRTYHSENLWIETTAIEADFGFPRAFLDEVSVLSAWPKDEQGNPFGASPEWYHFGVMKEAVLRLSANLSAKEASFLNFCLSRHQRAGQMLLQETVLQFKHEVRPHYQRRSWSVDRIETLLNKTHTLAHRTWFIRVGHLDTGQTLGTLILVLAPFGERVREQRSREGEVIASHSEQGQFGHLYKILFFEHPYELLIPLDIEVSIRKKMVKSQGLSWPGPLYLPMEEDSFSVRRIALPSDQHLDEIQGVYEATPTSAGTYEIDRYQEGLVLEPRLLTVQKELSPEVYARIIYLLLCVLRDPYFSTNFNHEGKRLATTNDLPQLYYRFGFRPTGESRVIDGRRHFTLEATASEVLSAIAQLSDWLRSPHSDQLAKLAQESF